MRERSETKSIQMVVDGLIEEHRASGVHATVFDVDSIWTRIDLSFGDEENPEKWVQVAQTFQQFFGGEHPSSPYENKESSGNESGSNVSYVVRLKS